jgi:hypothetical protein
MFPKMSKYAASSQLGLIVGPIPKEFRILVVPVFQGVDGHLAFEDGLRDLAFVEADIAQDRLFEVLAGAEAVALRDVLDTPCGSACKIDPHLGVIGVQK